MPSNGQNQRQNISKTARTARRRQGQAAACRTNAPAASRRGRRPSRRSAITPQAFQASRRHPPQERAGVLARHAPPRRRRTRWPTAPQSQVQSPADGKLGGEHPPHAHRAVQQKQPGAAARFHDRLPQPQRDGKRRGNEAEGAQEVAVEKRNVPGRSSPHSPERQERRSRRSWPRRPSAPPARPARSRPSHATLSALTLSASDCFSREYRQRPPRPAGVLDEGVFQVQFDHVHRPRPQATRPAGDVPRHSPR